MKWLGETLQNLPLYFIFMNYENPKIEQHRAFIRQKVKYVVWNQKSNFGIFRKNFTRSFLSSIELLFLKNEVLWNNKETLPDSWIVNEFFVNTIKFVRKFILLWFSWFCFHSRRIYIMEITNNANISKWRLVPSLFI